MWAWTDGSGETRLVHVLHVRPEVATVSTGHPKVVGAPGERFDVPLPVDSATFRLAWRRAAGRRRPGADW